MQAGTATDTIERECVLVFKEKASLSFSSLSQLLMLIDNVALYLHAYLSQEGKKILLRTPSSKTVWEYPTVGLIDTDGKVSIEIEPILRHIQDLLIESYLRHDLFERTHLTRAKLIRDFFNYHLTISNVADSLTIETISFNSPLVIKVKSVTYVLIVLTFIGGGKFEAGLEGIKVEMPGVKETICAIRESLFPIEKKAFRDQISEIGKRDLNDNIISLIRGDD